MAIARTFVVTVTFSSGTHSSHDDGRSAIRAVVHGVLVVVGDFLWHLHDERIIAIVLELAEGTIIIQRQKPSQRPDAFTRQKRARKVPVERVLFGQHLPRGVGTIRQTPGDANLAEITVKKIGNASPEQDPYYNGRSPRWVDIEPPRIPKRRPWERNALIAPKGPTISLLPMPPLFNFF